GNDVKINLAGGGNIDCRTGVRQEERTVDIKRIVCKRPGIVEEPISIAACEIAARFADKQRSIQRQVAGHGDEIIDVIANRHIGALKLEGKRSTRGERKIPRYAQRAWAFTRSNRTGSNADVANHSPFAFQRLAGANAKANGRNIE